MTARFYAHVMALLDDLRNGRLRGNGTGPTPAELITIGLATQFIREGNQLPRLFTPLSPPGWNPSYQSFVFVTDAGADHIKITVQDPELLARGIVVHVEHIDRSETSDRSLMEAYRLPSHITATRVRMHVGDLAPTSCFIGRPTFEGLGFDTQWPRDQKGNAFGALARHYCDVVGEAHDDRYFYNATLLKAAHNTASACTAMFEAGVVDCKIAIENMTEEQAVKFMRAVVANVRRDPEKQVLSAAFNINRPMYSEKKGRVIGRNEPGRSEASNLEEFIELAVSVAAEGRFDKVTLDGASERKDASIPVVNQLSHRQILKFAHLAHERGLITYLSAGIDASNLYKAVQVGIDGLGIGFALHMQAQGAVGALSRERINAVLDARDAAEKAVLGRAGKVLALLDYFAAFGVLTTEEDVAREALYSVLDQEEAEKIDEREVTKAMEAAGPVVTSLKKTIAQYKDKELAIAAALLKRGNDAQLAATPGVGRNVAEALSVCKQQGDIAGLRHMLRKARNAVTEARCVGERIGAGQGSSHASGSGKGVFQAHANGDATASALGTMDNGGSRSNGKHAKAFEKLKATLANATAAGSGGFSAGRVFERTDLAGMSANDVLQSAAGRVFVGLRGLPTGVTEEDLLDRGAIVIKPQRYLPFKVGLDHLYTAQELLDNDQNVYNWYKNYDHDSYDQIMTSLHDAVVLDLLRTQYRNRKQVGVMGSHSMRRDDPVYREIAYLCRDLARSDFVIATGGGQGAMEAANLGAHFAKLKDAELDEALDILAAAPDFKTAEGPRAAKVVFDRWPTPNILSLGIPTFLYGDEPPNLFCYGQAKFFSNAVREDVLVLTCNCGIIFAPGSAGTRTEIAQFAVPQVYSDEKGKDFSKPMIFFGNFWTENTVYQTYLNLAQREQLEKPRPTLHYATKIYQTADKQEILKIVGGFYAKYYPYGDIARGVAPVVDAVPKQKREGSLALRAREPKSDTDYGKRAAAYKAIDDWVNRDGMVIGIGSGDTVEFAVDRLAQIIAANGWKQTVCVPTSFTSRYLLKKYSDVLTVRDMLTEERVLDVAFDGADAVDAALRLIKGSGGALMTEKVVADSAKHFIVLAEWRKDADTLSSSGVLVPIEVKPLAWKRVQNSILRALGVEARLKQLTSLVDSQTPFATENGHYILEAALTAEQLNNTADSLRVLHGIAGVVAVGIMEHATTAAYFGRADGKVVIRERVATRDGSMIASAEQQRQALQRVLDAVERHRAESPVVEIDLDLCSLMPHRRTLAALAEAGQAYGVLELSGPLVQEAVPLLPGYTAAAWNEWLKDPAVAAIVSLYPNLPWEGVDANKDTPKGEPGATVHSAFHLRFWASAEEMEDDVVTAGLGEFEDAVQARGGKVVFLSGRWKPDMARASLIALRRARLGNEPNLVIGNRGHDDPSKKVGDAEAKKMAQDGIRAEYGLPVAMFDDRKSNLDAVASLKGTGKVAEDFITVVSCIPGYSAAPLNAAGADLLVHSNFYLNRVDPRAPATAATPPAVAAAGTQERSMITGVDATVSAATEALGSSALLRGTTRVDSSDVVAAPVVLPHIAEMSKVLRSNGAGERREQGIVRVATFNAENLFRRFDFSKRPGGGKNTGKDDSSTSGGVVFSDGRFTINNIQEKSLTAATILAVDADVIALQEVESLDLLDLFNKDMLFSTYKYRILVQGNDQRGINVAVLSRYPFQAINTARFAAVGDGGVSSDLQYVEEESKSVSYIFSRDCLRVDVAVPGGNTLHMYVNHFKSMAGGREETRAKRLEQSKRVAAMLERDHGADLGGHYVLVCGDFNDYEDDDAGTLALIQNPLLENVVRTRLPEAEQWTHFFAKEKSYTQLDYLLLSLALSEASKGVRPIIERRGQPKRAEKYQGKRFDGIGVDRPKASDHCPVALDIMFPVQGKK